MSTTHTSPHYISAAAPTFATKPASLTSTTAPAGPASAAEPAPDHAVSRYFSHSSARRINTDCTLVDALRQQYPGLEPIIVPQESCNLLAFAAAGQATIEPLDDDGSSARSRPYKWATYIPPPRRLDGETGILGEVVFFAKYAYTWGDSTFVVYYADGRDGDVGYPQTQNYYILTPARAAAERLLLAAGRWGTELRQEILVFDQGRWHKDKELFHSAMKSSWDNVIMDGEMKEALIDDHLSFFAARQTYEHLKVPWKRGIIYYGPPGNGKTISIKATMRMLYELSSPVPTLYVRSLASFGGPEYAIMEIFSMARRHAPCYLVFEDLDTIVTDDVRSYFLNEVDGLKANEGIFMIGSTNHLDRLDPGISKRPSRFDRKYFFADPNLSQRTQYCYFWQRKLASNKDVEFPDKLCRAIAEITGGFSFAYMQEAFVAALLAIAQREEKPRSARRSNELRTRDIEDEWVDITTDDDLDGLVLWVEMKKQVSILREGMEDKSLK